LPLPSSLRLTARVEITRGQQRHRTALLGAAVHAGEHFVDQQRVGAGVARSGRERRLGGAAGRALDADHVHFEVLRCTPGSMRTRTRTSLSPLLAGAGQTLAERCGQLVETLPGGAELTGLRALFGNAEAVVLEELAATGQTSAGERWASTQRLLPLRCRL
jgi:hypothetical protein